MINEGVLMNFFLRVFIGLLVVSVGIACVLRTNDIVGFFGSIEWADEKMGPAGTQLLYKLLGVLAIFIGLVVTFNLWNSFVGATLGIFLPGAQSTYLPPS
jgi:hypothetical protein